MCGQYHHVIPRELGTWLFEEYSLEWDDNFDGYTVFMAQCGSHSQYTERIKNIIAENCTVNHDITNPLKDDRHQYHDCIKKFAENLVNMIKKIILIVILIIFRKLNWEHVFQVQFLMYLPKEEL